MTTQQQNTEFMDNFNWVNANNTSNYTTAHTPRQNLTTSVPLYSRKSNYTNAQTSEKPAPVHAYSTRPPNPVGNTYIRRNLPIQKATQNTHIQPEKRKRRIEHFQEAFMRKGIRLFLDRKLGNGKYSKVYKAHDFHSDRMIALKVIDLTELSNDVREKFLPREISCWQKLRHKFLVAMHAQYESGNMIFFSMEFGSRGDLLKYVQKNGAIDEIQAGIYMSQLIRALDFMHKKSIAHRDVKLENIMLFDGCIKLSDFGFVRQMEKGTLSETFCGSKSYSAPELLKGTCYDPFLSDIWSAGVVGFVMVTDRMPFNESLPNPSIVENQKNRNYHIPNRMNLSLACVTSIERMMTYDVAVRPNSSDCLALPWIAHHREMK